MPRLRLGPLLLLASFLIVTGCSGPAGDRATATTGLAGDSVTATATSRSIPAAATGVATGGALAATSTVGLTATSTPTVMSTATSAPEATATAEPTATTTPTVAPPAATTPPTEPPAPTSAPDSSAGFITIRAAATDEPIVALTFDAGADRGFAGDILDTLLAEGVVATFGMTGHWAESNPDLVQRMVDERHMLMNHTWTHRSFTGNSTSVAPLTSAERAEELRSTEDIIRSLTGYELRPYFRPPYGDYDDSVIADLQANGYSVNVMWTVDSLGWKGLTAEEITQRVMDGNIPGAIHLFHVGAQSQDAAALPEIIRQLRDLGYRFVAIETMVGR